jgi:glycosyltransferase involved in cell wall biosynthesis
MKILHINTFDQGGAAIAAVRLHKALLTNGIDSSILFLKKRDNSIPNSIQFFEETSNHKSVLKRLFNLFWEKVSFRFSKEYSNWQKLLNKPTGFELFSFNPTDIDITKHPAYKNADIIHLHWTAGFLDYSFFKKNNKPVVWTLHDMNPFTGGCHYSTGCEKYKNECKNCPQLQNTKDPNNAFIDQKYKQSFIKRQQIVITAPSIWLRDCSQNSAIFKGLEHIHIPYSLSTSIFDTRDREFSRSVFNIPFDKKILLFVSDSIENKRKGFDLLINTLIFLNNPDIHICAIGDLNTIINYPPNITFLGRISDERLMTLAYSAADAFVLPTSEDNLPNVMLESLACGTPVIAFPVGGILDVIETGFNGILANNISSTGLADALVDFIENRYIFDRNKIRRETIANFSPSIQANKYLEVYKILTPN